MKREEVYQLIENSPNMPAIPQEISDIFEWINQPEHFDVELLAEKIARCPELNQAILANVNSGYYRMPKKMENIQEAVVFLGMKTTRNLIIYFITDLLFRDESGTSTLFSNHQYWKHNIGTAVACNLLSAQLDIGDRFKLFSYGLCHDIGFAVIHACLPDEVDKIYEIMQKGIHQVVAEKIVLGGTTHADVGSWVCKKWGIPEDIGAVIEFHHSPQLSKENTDEINLIYLADCISTNYYEKLLGLQMDYPIHNKVLDELNVTTELIDDIGAALPAEIDKVSRFFGLPQTSMNIQ